MKKEVKYALLSIPATYLLILIIGLTLDYYGTNTEIKACFWWNIQMVCNISKFFSRVFDNATMISVFFAPVYILIAILTYFIVGHSRAD